MPRGGPSGRAQRDATPAAIALACAISHDPVVVIPGASTVSQLEANAAAGGITLAPALITVHTYEPAAYDQPAQAT